MSSFEEITAAIAEWPKEEVKSLHSWLEEQAERDWDEQIAADERAGRLDSLIERALEEHRAGRTRPL